MAATVHAEAGTDNGSGEQYKKKLILGAVRASSLSVIAAGGFGLLHLMVAPRYDGGIFALLFGPTAFLPANTSSPYSYIITVSLLISFWFAATSFLLLSHAFGRNVYEGYNRRYARISFRILAVPYLESIIFVLVALWFGYSASSGFQPVSLNSGNLLESLLYVGAWAFLGSFIVMTFGGIFFSFFGIEELYVIFHRSEFVLFGAAILIGVFYPPLFLVAGILGLFASTLDDFPLRIALRKAGSGIRRILNPFDVNSGLYFSILTAGAVILAVSFRLSSILKGVEAYPGHYYYIAPYQNMYTALGIILGVLMVFASLSILYRKRIRLIIAAELSIFAAIMAISLYQLHLDFTHILNAPQILSTSMLQVQQWSILGLFLSTVFSMTVYNAGRDPGRYDTLKKWFA